MISKKGLVVITVLSLLVFSAQIAIAENSESQNIGDSQAQEDNFLQNKEQNQSMEQIGENNMLQWRQQYRNKIQEGVQNMSVAMECNISKQAGKLYINSYEYQKGMTLEIKEQSQHKLQVKVSAGFKEGKVIVLNIEGSAFKVKSSHQLTIKFDGKEIKEANIDEVINGNGTGAKYTAAIGEDGGQYLVYIPHFSEHMISFEILDVTTSQSMDFMIGAIGIAILTVLILVVVVFKIRKLEN